MPNGATYAKRSYLWKRELLMEKGATAPCESTLKSLSRYHSGSHETVMQYPRDTVIEWH
jgi:hypothetical protein